MRYVFFAFKSNGNQKKGEKGERGEKREVVTIDITSQSQYKSGNTDKGNR